MGRSRGGLTTKIYALVDANGLPIRIKLTEGQAHDGRRAADMLGELKAGQILLADRVNDSNALRIAMADQGAWANIRPTPHSRVDPPAFSPFPYRYRNLVERFFNKLKHYHTIAARYEKHTSNYRALVKLAAIRICLVACLSPSVPNWLWGRDPEGNGSYHDQGCPACRHTPYHIRSAWRVIL